MSVLRRTQSHHLIIELIRRSGNNMGNWIKLTSSDGKELSAYLAKPATRAKGGVVVIQEIFGVTRSIRAVVEWLAGEGYIAIRYAPFGRVAPPIDLGNAFLGMQKAFT